MREIGGFRGLAVVLALGGALALLGCSDSSGSGARGRTGGGGEEAEEPPQADAIAVRVEPVIRRAVSSLYSTSATLRADKQATVTARTTGVIRRLLVEEGDLVRSGQMMAVLEDDEQKIEYDRTSTNYEAKRRDYERSGKLHTQGLLSEEDFESARREHDEAKQANALAELALSRTVIRAPFAGKVLRRQLDVGATVTDGTDVYDLADLLPLYADVNVPERHVVKLSPGQTVRLRADASGVDAAAAIERIAPSVDPATGTVKVTVAVDGSARLRPGAFVRVDIVTDTHDDALLVPRPALVAEGRRWHLFRLAADEGTVQQLEVSPGFEETDRVEILEVFGEQTALVPGERVVVVGAAALSDGAPVLLVPEEPEEPAEPVSDPAGA